jgi:hypothetical protein
MYAVWLLPHNDKDKELIIKTSELAEKLTTLSV